MVGSAKWFKMEACTEPSGNRREIAVEMFGSSPVNTALGLILNDVLEDGRDASLRIDINPLQVLSLDGVLNVFQGGGPKIFQGECLKLRRATEECFLPAGTGFDGKTAPSAKGDCTTRLREVEFLQAGPEPSSRGLDKCLVANLYNKLPWWSKAFFSELVADGQFAPCRVHAMW